MPKRKNNKKYRQPNRLLIDWMAASTLSTNFARKSCQTSKYKFHPKTNKFNRQSEIRSSIRAGKLTNHRILCPISGNSATLSRSQKLL